MEFVNEYQGHVHEVEADITQITRKIEKGYHRTKQREILMAQESYNEPTPIGLRRKRRR